VKLSRLFQPRNPQFWLLVALNVLSAAISHLLRKHALAPALEFAFAVFAVANMVIGIRIALRLMADPTPAATTVEQANTGAAAGIHQNNTNNQTK
jgi:hypothetical protein